LLQLCANPGGICIKAAKKLHQEAANIWDPPSLEAATEVLDDFLAMEEQGLPYSTTIAWGPAYATLQQAVEGVAAAAAAAAAGAAPAVGGAPKAAGPPQQ
jgi:hypothetical protein